jgi:hypothetical protein
MEVDPFDRHDVPRHDLKRVSVSLIKSLWQLFFAWNKYASLNSTGKSYIPRNRKLEKMTLILSGRALHGCCSCCFCCDSLKCCPSLLSKDADFTDKNQHVSFVFIIYFLNLIMGYPNSLFIFIFSALE